MVSLESITAGLQILGGLGLIVSQGIDFFVLEPNPIIHVPHIALGILGCLITKWSILSLLLYTYFTLGLTLRAYHQTLGNTDLAFGVAIVSGLTVLLQVLTMFISDEEEEEEGEKDEKDKKKDK